MFLAGTGESREGRTCSALKRLPKPTDRLQTATIRMRPEAWTAPGVQARLSAAGSGRGEAARDRAGISAKGGRPPHGRGSKVESWLRATSGADQAIAGATHTAALPESGTRLRVEGEELGRADTPAEPGGEDRRNAAGSPSRR
jgi:hypothetical protein